MSKNEESNQPAGVRAKLQAHKDANQNDRTVTLRRSGVVCTVPNFINHGQWMAAQRIAGGDVQRAQAAFVAEVVRFEGEKLTLADIHELLPAGDVMQLTAEVFRGGPLAGGGEGNGERAPQLQ